MAPAPTQFRTAIRNALNAEFAPESLTFDDDKLSGAVATDRPRAAVYPLNQGEGRNTIDQQLEVRIQIFRKWQKEIEPEQSVSPSDIEAWVERTQRALKAVSRTGTEKAWFFRVTRVDYLPDPTGNITRAEISVRGFGENPAILETAA